MNRFNNIIKMVLLGNYSTGEKWDTLDESETLRCPKCHRMLVCTGYADCVDKCRRYSYVCVGCNLSYDTKTFAPHNSYNPNYYKNIYGEKMVGEALGDKG